MTSFRDPAGAVLLHQERVFRVVYGSATASVKEFLESDLAQKLQREGQLVPTAPLAAGDPGFRDFLSTGGVLDRDSMLLEHEKVPFPSFPYEWSPAMLHAAGHLTLTLAQEALPHQYGLKDATPFNVLFRGPEPVFVDLLSFERRDCGDPAWLAYAQFLQTFVYPLLLNRARGLQLAQFFQTDREGVTPESAFRLLGPLRASMPPWLWLIAVPALFQGGDLGGATIYSPRRTSPEQADYILNRVFRSLHETLDRCAPRQKAVTLNIEYQTTGNNYTDEDSRQKEEFVSEALCALRPKRVLDIGCNTGQFSALAARENASVVSVDRDPAVVDVLWRKARKEKLDILPLAVNFASPSPATGWRNSECPSFLDRAAGRFDLVLMLAIAHHLLVTERVPLEEIFDLASRLTNSHLVIEYVDPKDSQFQRILCGRDALYSYLTREIFEKAFASRFRVVRKLTLTSGLRTLYLLKKVRTV